jgi:hypothetical protein
MTHHACHCSYVYICQEKNGRRGRRLFGKWWHYAITAVTYEVRLRRHKLALFENGVPFSWGNQKYRRREYVDLYITTHLEASGTFINKIAGRMNETILREIEDELPVEQILLYRAIARALRVRGMKKMPNSLLGLHGEKHVAISSSRKRDKKISQCGCILGGIRHAGSRGRRHRFSTSVAGYENGDARIKGGRKVDP